MARKPGESEDRTTATADPTTSEPTRTTEADDPTARIYQLEHDLAEALQQRDQAINALNRSTADTAEQTAAVHEMRAELTQLRDTLSSTFDAAARSTPGAPPPRPADEAETVAIVQAVADDAYEGSTTYTLDIRAAGGTAGSIERLTIDRQTPAAEHDAAIVGFAASISDRLVPGTGDHRVRIVRPT